MVYIYFFVLIIILILLAYFYTTRNFLYWKKRGVKFVAPLPFVGNLLDLITVKKSPGQLLDGLYNSTENEPYVGFFGLDKPMLLIRDPEIIKNILVKDFNFFNDRFAATSPNDHLGYANLFLLKNPAWKYVRSKLTPIYTSGRLKLMFERMLEVFFDLDTYLASLDLKGNGKSIELKEICAKFTTDMVGITAYGLKVNSLNNPNAEFRKNGKKMFQLSYSRVQEFNTIFFAPVLTKIFGIQFFSNKLTKFLRDALWSTIIEREQSGQKRNDLVDLLIELKNNDVNNPDKKIFAFDGDNLTAQAAVFFTAGFDTSSSLLSFTLYSLAIHPEIQDRVREEMKNTLNENNGKLTYEIMMNQLTYTQMVISETLRLYPVLPFLDRVADEDYKIPNHNLVIEKGTPVFISISSIQMDPKYHDNPDKFDPERFSNVNTNAASSTYFSFGMGPHACIGQRLGLLQTKLGLVKMISNYEFTPCEETVVPLEISPKGLLTATESGIYLNVRKIDD